MLLNDRHDLIQKAVGSWLRESEKGDKKGVIAFQHGRAAKMPRTVLRYTVENLDGKQRKVYLGEQ
jgi:3-methyladenine DNA glycosylase AlkD